MAYVAVGIAGFIGACIRYFIGEQFGTLHGFPLPTLLINWTGSFVLTWFYTVTVSRVAIHPHLRLAIGTGLIGSFTTFSTFTVETWKLWQAGLWWSALLYIILSFAGGLGLSWIGYRLADKDSRLRFTTQVNEEA